MNMCTVSESNVTPFVCESTEVTGEGRGRLTKSNIEFVLFLPLKKHSGSYLSKLQLNLIIKSNCTPIKGSLFINFIASL